MKRQYQDASGQIWTVAEPGPGRWLAQPDDGEERGGAMELRRTPDGSWLMGWPREAGPTVFRPVQVSVTADAVWITTAAGTSRWLPWSARRGAAASQQDAVSSPMTGRVVVVPVSEGQEVSAGDVLVVVEAMKMEQPLTAPRDGVVASVQCEAGELVDGGVELVRLAPEEEA